MTGASPSETVRVLVVCTGNLCRSPLVAALLARRLAAHGIAAVVTSAGTAAPPGASPDRRLLRVAGELGLDLRDHRSRPLTRSSVVASDLVITMTSEQIECVERLAPEGFGRTVTLRGAAWRAAALRGTALPVDDWLRRLAAAPADGATRGPGEDIDDPIGGPVRGYRDMARDVDHLTGVLADAWGGA